MVLGLVILLGGMTGNRIFQSISLENVRFKKIREIFPKSEGAPFSRDHILQGNYATAYCSKMCRYEWLVTVASWKKNGPMIRPSIMPPHTLSFGVSLWCSIFYRHDRMPHTLQLCLFTIQSKRNIASWEKKHWVQASLVATNFLQHFVTKPLSCHLSRENCRSLNSATSRNICGSNSDRSYFCQDMERGRTTFRLVSSN
jgi:hypothetical protein